MAPPLSKTLPPGTWLHIARLPLKTTAAELSAFLYECGLQIPPENISVKDFIENAGAFVSVPKAEVAYMFNWVLNGKKLGGQAVEGTVPLPPKERAA